VATPARVLAFRILQRVEGPGSTLADELAAAEGLPTRERAFLHELVLGTLRHRGAMDHALAARTNRPLAGLDGPVRAALRLGAYQILRLRVPAHAAVAESVDLARSARAGSAGFVNAVLRRLARDAPLASPEPALDPLPWLTSEGSLPDWLAERWLARLGPSRAVERARALLLAPPVVFRFNPRVPDAAQRARQAGLVWREVSVPGALEVTGGRPGPLAEQGVLYLQDAGSQLVARLAASSGRLLDACAAPGGKATLLADLAGADTRVIAMEASPRRLATLRRLALRWGASDLLCVGADASRPPFRGQFDSVLLDAPCSGLGTLARHPDIRWRARPGDLARHAARQRLLLDSLAPLVADGGRLVYATCSVEPEENEEVLTAFLVEHPEFEPVPLPDWAVPFREGSLARTLPERDGGDAFSAAVLARRGT
jgi:16S rRNA (cytosine967-C5)-methyltransferase